MPVGRRVVPRAAAAAVSGHGTDIQNLFPGALVLYYLGEHFWGRQSLTHSFWVNFVALASVLYFTGTIIRDIAASDSRFLVGFLAFVSLNIIIYSWQVFGVWRASERALQEHAWFLWARGAQVVVVLSVLVILGQILAYVHLSVRTDPPPPGGDDVPGYVLDLSPDGTVVTVSGDIDFGITRDMTRMLESHARIGAVSLDSPGGLVSEARGLAKLITRRKLATYVAGTCSSSCTQVYISGERRFLGPEARLGFHSYRLDSPYSAIFMDPAAEQRNDLALFHDRQVDPAFLERILDTPHDAIWFPSHDELLDSGIAHEVRTLR